MFQTTNQSWIIVTTPNYPKNKGQQDLSSAGPNVLLLNWGSTHVFMTELVTNIEVVDVLLKGAQAWQYVRIRFCVLL